MVRAICFDFDGTPLWQDSCHHLKFNQLGALRVDSVSL